jgi:hypothetical protein
MPRKPVKAKGGGYDIVGPTGKKYGHSSSKAKAEASARAANAASHGWKPSRRGGKKGKR